mgnify:CR=1 FL=1
MVQGSVKETLNELMKAEAEKLIQAAQYGHHEQQQSYLPKRRYYEDLPLDCKHRMRTNLFFDWEIIH